MAVVSPFQSSVKDLAPGAAEQLRQLRAQGCLWRQSDLARIRMHGADVAQWLHGQSTQSVTDMVCGEGRFACFLDPRGKLLYSVELLCAEDHFDVLVARDQAQGLVERFAAYLFTEDVQVNLISDSIESLWIQGPCAEEVCKETDCYPGLSLVDRAWVFHDQVLWRRASMCGEAGLAAVGEPDAIERLHDDLLHQAQGRLLPMGDQAALIARLEAGLPSLGSELTNEEILPETPWMELAYKPGKGCFTGQEVVERLRMKGSPKVALVALIGPLDMPVPAVGSKVRVDGKNEGSFRASVPSAQIGGRLNYALLKRRHRQPGARFNVEIDDQDWPVRLMWLPPLEPRREAQTVAALYDEALLLFQRDIEERDPAVISVLRRAYQIDPSHEDVLELLGVALHRRGERTEAIELMIALLKRNPKSIMGWTNLSRFYAEEGRIEEAEEAQGQATMLSFQRDLAGRRAAADVKAKAEAESAERKRRMSMFKEVLEFDPDDLVALFGLGKAYVEEGELEAAMEPLLRAVEVKGDYAAAWLELGRCQERLDDLAGARASYESGIAAAARRGELMPMRAMERRLAALGSPAV